MKINNRKEFNLYTRGQQFLARVLFIVWLLVGCPGSVLAGESSTVVAAKLSTLTKEGQQLMKYAADLDVFIPQPLVDTLLGGSGSSSEVQLNLVSQQLVTIEEVDLGVKGLRVSSEEVQEACKKYSWSNEVALGVSTWLKLAKVLEGQMPLVKASRDERWEIAALYAPHVDTVLNALKKSRVTPSAVEAYLLGCMGQYAKEVLRSNTVDQALTQAYEYQQKACDIYRALLALSLGELGTIQSHVGEREKALESKLAALEQKRIVAGTNSEGNDKDDPEVAHSLNSVGQLHTSIANGQENKGKLKEAQESRQQALEYTQAALKMRQRLYQKQDHSDVARSLTSVGICYEDLENLQEALQYKKASLDMQQRLLAKAKASQSQGNINKIKESLAHAYHNVGLAYIKSGDATTGLQHCQQGLEMRRNEIYAQEPDHMYIAQSLNGVGFGHERSKNYVEAAEHYQQAVMMALNGTKATQGKTHPHLAEYCENIIRIFSKLEANKVQEIKTALKNQCAKIGVPETLIQNVLDAPSEDISTEKPSTT